MILEASNVVKSYYNFKTELRVLKGIDLSIKKGEIVSVVGPSGAGKSTLLHVLGGLDQPNRGMVRLDGEDIYSLDDAARARIRNARIGFVFQFYHLLPEFTALENVFLPTMIRDPHAKRSELIANAADLLAKVGLKERMEHTSSQLSGGEQQRVAIARALVNHPKIVFCDEPTGNLDSQSGKGIIDLLLSLNKEEQQTLVIVTHDEDIAKRSNRTVHIKDGILQ